MSCSICLSLNAALPHVHLACAHAFHEECIEQWLAKNDTCPLCRATVDNALSRLCRARIKYQRRLAAHTRSVEAKRACKRALQGVQHMKHKREELRLELDLAVANEENARDAVRAAQKALHKANRRR